MYYQKFQLAKAKEGESLAEIVTHLMDMAAKWLKEYDTREKVIDTIVTVQSITMLSKVIRARVKERKPEKSMHNCWEVSRLLTSKPEKQ